jgi:hypothetical protein
MPRVARGTTVWEPATSKREGHYKSRIVLKADPGSKPWIHHDPGPRSKEALARAVERAAHWTEKAAAEGRTREDFGLVPRGPRVLVERAAPASDAPVRAGTPETVSTYAKRWIKARTGRVASVGDNESHLEHHVLPVLGPVLVAKVTRADVERLVAALDEKVRAGALSSKSAKNIWGTCSKLFDDATNAKPATGLRCLDSDPTTGVRGPDDDDADKILQFLYPSEVAAFLACEGVPLRWRRNVVIAVYLCLRDGEQRALKWTSVDLVHAVVTIQETFDRRAFAGPRGNEERRRPRGPYPPRAAPPAGGDARGERRGGLRLRAALPPRHGTRRPALAPEGGRDSLAAAHRDERLETAPLARLEGDRGDVARGRGEGSDGGQGHPRPHSEQHD